MEFFVIKECRKFRDTFPLKLIGHYFDKMDLKIVIQYMNSTPKSRLYNLFKSIQNEQEKMSNICGKVEI